MRKEDVVVKNENGVAKVISAVDRALYYVEVFFIAASTIVMGVVLAGNFISRNLLDSSWLFAEEVGQFMLIIQCFSGMSYCVRMGRHIRMSAVFDVLPQKVKRFIMIVICLMTAIALAYLGYLGIGWAARTYASGKVSSVLRFPMWIVYCVIPFGCFMSVMQYIITLVKNITDRENIWVGTNATDLEAE